MIFFDTNVMVYSTVLLDTQKQKISDKLIETAINEKTLSISPLVLSEFIFVLSKLKIDSLLIDKSLSFYRPYVKYSIEPALVFEAYELCKSLVNHKNINDAIHLKFAEKHCSKIVTFDGDFKLFKNHTTIEISICN